MSIRLICFVAERGLEDLVRRFASQRDIKYLRVYELVLKKYAKGEAKRPQGVLNM